MIEEIGIREISAANTFAYAYVCLLRYVSNSIEAHCRDRVNESNDDFVTSNHDVKLMKRNVRNMDRPLNTDGILVSCLFKINQIFYTR